MALFMYSQRQKIAVSNNLKVLGASKQKNVGKQVIPEYAGVINPRRGRLNIDLIKITLFRSYFCFCYEANPDYMVSIQLVTE